MAIIKYLRHHGRKNLQKYETAGKIVDNWMQEGQYRSGRQATEILRSTGCIGHGHGPKKVDPNKQLLKGLHVATSVVKLTNRAIIVIGNKNIVAGSHYAQNEEEDFETPYTILALAGAIVSTFFCYHFMPVIWRKSDFQIEIELREIRKLPPTGGELGPPSGHMNSSDEKILKSHQGALLMDQVCQTHEIAIVMDEIQKDFRLPKLASRMNFSKEKYWRGFHDEFLVSDPDLRNDALSLLIL